MKKVFIILGLILLPVVVTFGSLFYAFNYLPLDFFGLKTDKLGTSLTTINGSDKINTLPTTLNANFTALNNGKIEVGTTSVSSITALPNLATVGTINSGTWNGTKVAVPYGGTNQTSFYPYSILIGNGTNAIATTATGTAGQLLTYSTSSAPYWASPSINTSDNYTWYGNHSFVGGVSTLNFTSAGTSTFAGYTLGAGFIHSQIITASTTWSKPTDVKYVKIRMVGGGGGGGCNTSNNNYGGGGGAGGYVEKIIDVSATTSINVVVGTAGTSTQDGTASVFGTWATSTGGTKGGVGTNIVAGGTGGTATGGDININGQTGFYGFTATYLISGEGGSSPLGFGGASCSASSNSTSCNGGNATGYGAGGGGCDYYGPNGATYGGNGSNGVVIIEY